MITQKMPDGRIAQFNDGTSEAQINAFIEQTIKYDVINAVNEALRNKQPDSDYVYIKVPAGDTFIAPSDMPVGDMIARCYEFVIRGAHDIPGRMYNNIATDLPPTTWGDVVAFGKDVLGYKIGSLPVSSILVVLAIVLIGKWINR